MIGVLAYLPTVALVPHILYVLIFIYLLFINREKIVLGRWKNLAIILFIIGLGIGNNISHTENIKKSIDYVPYLLLLIISYLGGLSFKQKDAKLFIYLVAIECIVVLVEFSMGTTTFFTSIEGYQKLNNASGLLYDSRPFGLSDNSSIIALKILIAILLLFYYKLKEKWIILAKALLAIGFVLTFNRTVILSIVFFFILYFLIHFNQLKLTKWKIAVLFLSFAIVSIGASFYADEIFTRVVAQFTRNTGKIEMAGRGLIWQHYIEYIQHHFLFGNGSYKYLFHNVIVDYTFHAHNSFLQALSTNGIFIFMLYVLFVLLNINRQNAIYVLTILLYSVSQYGVFWGVSLLDIILFTFLLQQNQILKIKTQYNE